MRTQDRKVQHDVILYDDDFDLVSAAIPFVRDGIEAGEVVMINTLTNPVTPLLRAMFADEEQVVIADHPVYSTPAAALDGYRRIMEKGLAEGAAGYRAMGYIDFDSSHLPWQEWLRYEAAVNRVFADFPFRTLCPYDVSLVPTTITDPVMRAHTGLVTPEGWVANQHYVDPEELVTREELRTPPLPIQSGTPRMVLQPSRDLMELRMELYAATMFTGLPRVKVDDFVKAVGEVVTNAHKHGADPVRLRLWAADATLACTVTDQGEGITDPLAGYARPRNPSDGGLGLWAARQLVDVLDYEHGPDGFTVRVALLT
ncbi:MAG TPA: sensor histidine kinase [Nocardioidaceae bacterium]|nr:sensor histidine kinase [Nocardioidaceae bacterium]